MVHKRKGQLTITKEWAKHLRKFWRRQFWKVERNAGRKVIRRELEKKMIAYNIAPQPRLIAPLMFRAIAAN
jgi:hypothetical protein